MTRTSTVRARGPAGDAPQGAGRVATAGPSPTVAPSRTHEVDDDGLTPGARHFLAQREAQGLGLDVTDEQAERLAILFTPIPSPLDGAA